jgi:hypothetical protein
MPNWLRLYRNGGLPDLARYDEEGWAEMDLVAAGYTADISDKMLGTELRRFPI